MRWIFRWMAGAVLLQTTPNRKRSAKATRTARASSRQSQNKRLFHGNLFPKLRLPTRCIGSQASMIWFSGSTKSCCLCHVMYVLKWLELISQKNSGDFLSGGWLRRQADQVRLRTPRRRKTRSRSIVRCQQWQFWINLMAMRTNCTSKQVKNIHSSR